MNSSARNTTVPQQQIAFRLRAAAIAVSGFLLACAAIITHATTQDDGDARFHALTDGRRVECNHEFLGSNGRPYRLIVVTPGSYFTRCEYSYYVYVATPDYRLRAHRKLRGMDSIDFTPIHSPVGASLRIQENGFFWDCDRASNAGQDD